MYKLKVYFCNDVPQYNLNEYIEIIIQTYMFTLYLDIGIFYFHHTFLLFPSPNRILRITPHNSISPTLLWTRLY
jgi:hypothetical protein